MDWPTKGSGKSYNSNTGSGAFCGGYTKKVLSLKIFCRRCRVCENAKRREDLSKEHDCVQNYPSDGSSKSMEPLTILHIATEAPKKKFVLHWITSDDDSVMCAHLKHKVSNLKSDKGKLSLWILETDFKADPGYRNKTMAGKLYKLANASVAKSRITPAMARRLKKNWRYILRQGKNCESVDKFKKNAQAVLEHMFNNHTHCNSQWCLALRAQEEDKQYTHPSEWLSRKVPEEEEMYTQLEEIVDVYGGEFYLRQSMHPFNTQTNSAQSGSDNGDTEGEGVPREPILPLPSCNCCWLAQLGSKEVLEHRFHPIGHPSHHFFVTYLDGVERKKAIQKVFHLKVETKRKRAHKQDACEKKLLYENRTAEYASGIRLDIGSGRYEEVKKGEEKKGEEGREPNKKRAKRTSC